MSRRFTIGQGPTPRWWLRRHVVARQGTPVVLHGQGGRRVLERLDVVAYRVPWWAWPLEAWHRGRRRYGRTWWAMIAATVVAVSYGIKLVNLWQRPITPP